MKSTNWIRALAATALLASACGSTPTAKVTPGSTPAASSDPSAVVTYSPSPSPATPNVTPTSPKSTPCVTTHTTAGFPPAATSNRKLALVTLHGSGQVVVRDITDISHAFTVSNVAADRPQFVSATDLSYVDGDQLIRAPLTGSPRTVVATACDYMADFAWSPDGNTVVYLTPTSSAYTVHQLAAGKDRVFGSVPQTPAVGCEQVANCFGADTWDYGVSYSRDGGFTSYVNSVANVSAFRLWASNGQLLKSSNSQSPFMTAWSGNSLYFRDAKGVEVWRAGVVSPFVPGVAWIRPHASACGLIVYQTRDAQRWSHTYVVDTTSGRVRDLGKAHAEPAFLSCRYVWYLGERACVPADGCGTRVAGVPSGKTYIFDLLDGTETESVITRVLDVWPHAA